MAMIDSQMTEIKSKLSRLDSTFWAAIAVVNAVLLTFAGTVAGVLMTMMWDRVKEAENRADKLKTLLETVQTRDEKLANENKEALAAISEARSKVLDEIEKAKAAMREPSQQK